MEKEKIESDKIENTKIEDPKIEEGKVKFGFVTIIGRPNAGKSTLINAIFRKKIVIATNRKNTTRIATRAIYSDEDSQIVFIDTPGFLEPRSMYDKMIKSEISNSLEEIDIVLLLVPFWDELDKKLMENVKNMNNVHKILVITQIDKSSDKRKVFQMAVEADKLNFFEKIIPISSVKSLNLAHLIQEIKDLLPYDVPQFDSNNIVDYNRELYISELIREKTLINLNDEIPHQLLVKIFPIKENEHKINIEAEIILNREGHKGILIGKNGEMIDKIINFTKKDLEKTYNKKINLKISIKVKKDWKNKINIIRDL